jgi:DNA-binding CsgD family transcriptional regulator
MVTALSATEVAALVDDYRAGATAVELASRFGIHRTTVVHHLQRNGVTMRGRGLDEGQVDHAVQLYRQGWSLARIGARLGVDAHTVRTALLGRGVQMRSTHGCNR